LITFRKMKHSQQSILFNVFLYRSIRYTSEHHRIMPDKNSDSILRIQSVTQSPWSWKKWMVFAIPESHIRHSHPISQSATSVSSILFRCNWLEFSWEVQITSLIKWQKSAPLFARRRRLSL
jgi:hypothetical protein